MILPHLDMSMTILQSLPRSFKQMESMSVDEGKLADLAVVGSGCGRGN